MNTQIQSLLSKEWIKVRRGIWLIPLLLLYAVVDSALTLDSMERAYGAFGQWMVLLTKAPLFFENYRVVIVCGLLIGVLQAWPETQGKRLRLLFHMPIASEKIIGVMVGNGLAWLAVINLVACGLLALTMSAFNMPADMIVPVLQTFGQWALLSFAVYLGTVALLGSTGLVMRALVLVLFFAAFYLLWGVKGYGAMAPSLGYYALWLCGFIPVIFYAYMLFMGEHQKGRLFVACRGLSLVMFALCLCALLPQLYWRVVSPPRTNQSLYYSPVAEAFITGKTTPDLKSGIPGRNVTEYKLEGGESVTRKELPHLLPFMYAKDLIKWNAFPETIGGKHITPRQAMYGWESTRLSPRHWNRRQPMLQLMLESNPQGASLRMPPDMFRVGASGHGLEFIQPETGKINLEKSAMFTQALKGQGFVFPVQVLANNPNIRKPYDYGFLMVDADNVLFRLQMRNGKPRCINSGSKLEGTVRGVTVKEHQRRDVIGYVFTDKGIYSVKQRTLTVHKLPIPDYSVTETYVNLWSDMLGRNMVTGVVGQSDKGIVGRALTTDFDVRKVKELPMASEDLATWTALRKTASVLFPLQLTQYDAASSFVSFEIKYAKYPVHAAASAFLMLALFVVGSLYTRRSVRVWDAVVVGLFGPVGLALVSVVCWQRKLNRITFKR